MGKSSSNSNPSNDGERNEPQGSYEFPNGINDYISHLLTFKSCYVSAL